MLARTVLAQQCYNRVDPSLHQPSFDADGTMLCSDQKGDVGNRVCTQKIQPLHLWTASEGTE